MNPGCRPDTLFPNDTAGGHLQVEKIGFQAKIKAGIRPQGIESLLGGDRKRASKAPRSDLYHKFQKLEGQSNKKGPDRHPGRK
jgi:hypothetical protein